MAHNFLRLPAATETTEAAASAAISFRAGKCRVDGNMVYADSRKGRLQICEGEDGLTHVQWLERSLSQQQQQQPPEDDLIVINDAYLEKVPHCTDGRVYCLRFTSSDKKLLYWMQEPDITNDDAIIQQFNRRAGGLSEALPSSQQEHMQSSSSASSSSSSSSEASGSQQAQNVGTEGLQQLRQLLADYSETLRKGRAHTEAVGASLSDVLNSQILARIANDSTALEELVELMPEGFRTEQDAREALRSPQLAGAMNSLTQAIYTNAAPLLSSMGVPTSRREALQAADPMLSFAQALEMQYKVEHLEGGKGSNGAGEVDSNDTSGSSTAEGVAKDTLAAAEAAAAETPAAASAAGARGTIETETNATKDAENNQRGNKKNDSTS